jgi:hypothetical protein
MEAYKVVQKTRQEKIRFILSCMGIAAHCDYCIHDWFNDGVSHFDEQCIQELTTGQKLFINTHIGDIKSYIDRICDILTKTQQKLNFFLLAEPTVNSWIIDALLPHTQYMYIQNKHIEHPCIYHMPIGIRDGEEVCSSHHGFSQSFLIDEGVKKVEKTNLCLLCFTLNNSERSGCYEIFHDKQFMTNLNKNNYERQPSIHCGKVPVWIFYEELHKSTYALCPIGFGFDTHRFFESLYLDTIPIVKKTNTCFDTLYSLFPCLLIDSWSDITEDFLKERAAEYTNKIQQFKQQYSNVYFDIDTITKIMRQPTQDQV